MSETRTFDDIDPDILDIFLEESRDLMDSCEQQFNILRENPDATDSVVDLQRSLHTLKGGARMAGILQIGNLSHGIETFLEVIARRKLVLEENEIHILGNGLDTLRDLVDKAAQRVMGTPPTDLIHAFEQLAANHIAPARQANELGSPAKQITDKDQDPIGYTLVEDFGATLKTSASLKEQKPQETAEGNKTKTANTNKKSSGQEQIRVKAELLDMMAIRTDEIAVQRAHLEQQLNLLRTTIQELGRTHSRMRDQLRRLEQETEAQIVSRYQREREKGEHSFDPLELDQFSSLQQLSRGLTESSDDISGLNETLDTISRQYEHHLQQQARAGAELQEGLMQTRMLPFDKMAPRLSRIVRLAATEVGKKVRLDLMSASGELDRNVIERIIAPLEHMLRNSIVHGIEPAEQRIRAGKPAEGTIRIGLRNEGPEIVISIEDDGGGLNREAIRRRAIQLGIIQESALIEDRLIDEMIFASGFSTAQKVDQLAGRGVGMDVVRNEVRLLGGNIEIHSIPGQGVKFTLRLPQKVAVVQAVFVRSGDLILAVPTTSIIGIGHSQDMQASTYEFAGSSYPIYTLRALAGTHILDQQSQEATSLLLVKSGELTAAIRVDQVMMTREVVVKSIGSQLLTIPGVYGATIDETGRAVVILDVAPLVRHYLNHKPTQPSVPRTRRTANPIIMVVDDSITMRKITGRVLERHKFEVKTARDGVDALEQLETNKPDLMLLDIEMPRMDGYELAGRMHNDPRYRDIPIIMITSRTGNKHRQRALDLGVRQYLGKPYQENEMLRHVHELLGLSTDQFKVDTDTANNPGNY